VFFFLFRSTHTKHPKIDATELGMYQEFLQYVIEAISAVVIHVPHQNLQFLYALLHDKKLFFQIEKEDMFSDSLHPIIKVSSLSLSFWIKRNR